MWLIVNKLDVLKATQESQHLIGGGIYNRNHRLRFWLCPMSLSTWTHDRRNVLKLLSLLVVWCLRFRMRYGKTRTLCIAVIHESKLVEFKLWDTLTEKTDCMYMAHDNNHCWLTSGLTVTVSWCLDEWYFTVNICTSRNKNHWAAYLDECLLKCSSSWCVIKNLSLWFLSYLPPPV